MAELVNVVRVVADDRRRWVADLTSIEQFGVFEGTLPVGNVPDDGALQQIGEAYLSFMAWPRESVVVEATDFGGKVGDTATVEGDTLRAVGLRSTFDPADGEGRWRTVASFNTLRQERQIRGERMIQRLIAQHGHGSGMSGRVRGGRSQVPSGRLSELGRQQWSWTELWEQEEEPWQPWKVDNYYRLYEFRVDCDWFTMFEGEFDEKVTVGDSRFLFSVNGETYTPPPIAEVPEEGGTAVVDLWGSALLSPGDEVRVWCSKDWNGMHINGTVSLLYSEAI